MSIERGIRPPEAREQEPQLDQFAGLHARLLTGELKSLHSDKEVSADDMQQIDSFKDRNYVPYEKAAKKGRKKYWKQQVEEGKVGQTKKEKYAKWEESMLSGINDNFSDDQKKEIFYPLFEKMGIAKADASEKFTEQDVRKLYDRYFSKEEEHKHPENTGVKQFVRDVLATYKKADGKPDEAKIEEHLPYLEQFAVIFGEDEAAMVAQLIKAEAKHANNPQALKRLDRINNLNDEEKHILNFIDESNPPPDLPVLRRTDEIKELAVKDPIILATAETGAGKTVGIPPIVRDTLKPGEKIIVTQPQQNTAMGTPNHIAGEFSLRVGDDIGYITGGGVKYDKRKTDVVFVTERIGLYQMRDRDEWFKSVRHMMFDEAHKLSPDMEIMAAFSLEEQQLRKREGAKIPLTVWFISATADEKKFKKYAKIDKSIKIEGRTFGKDVKFLDKSLYSKEDKPKEKSRKLYEAAAQKAAEITRDPDSEQGDIIISAAGDNEITEIEKLVNAQKLENIHIVRIQSGSTKKEKDELKKEAPKGIRRIIIGTNAMETGVTVKGAKYVINTGEKKDDFYDPITGMTKIPKVLQAQAEAQQWEGRVGRTSKGYVFHLMTEEEFNKRPEQPPSPIHKTDITQFVLLLKTAGRDIRDLKLPSGKLEEDRVKAAEETLQELGALDAKGNATEIGKRMAEIPTDYRITRAIAQAEKDKKGMKQMYALAAILDGKSIIHDKDKLGQLLDPNSEFITYLRAWEEFVKHGSKREWAQRHGLKFKDLKAVANRLSELQKRANFDEDSDASADELGYYLFLGYQDRLMHYDKEKKHYVWEREQVKDVKIEVDESSTMSGQNLPEYVISTTNSPINERDVKEKQSYKSGYSPRRGIKYTTEWVKVGTEKKSSISTIQAVKPEWIQ